MRKSDIPRQKKYFPVTQLISVGGDIYNSTEKQSSLFLVFLGFPKYPCIYVQDVEVTVVVRDFELYIMKTKSGYIKQTKN